MGKYEYYFSANSIIDTATFCNFHKKFIDYCKGKYECGTFHFLFRNGQSGLAFFETNGEIIGEDEYMRESHVAP